METEVELSKLRKENQLLKGQLQKSQEDNQNSKRQMAESIEEAGRIIDEQKTLLKEKEEDCQKKELEILSLREEVKKDSFHKLEV
jgi:hypothetical protein